MLWAQKHGIFNSWLCGAGYIYNRETKMCAFDKSFAKEEELREAAADEEATTESPSRETVEYVSRDDISGTKDKYAKYSDQSLIPRISTQQASCLCFHHSHLPSTTYLY
jgi:hypothetical protein